MGKIPPSDFKKVKHLYYDKKLGAPQVAKKLGVSIDAVYYFMRHNKLRRRSLSEENALRYERKTPSFRIRVHFSDDQKDLKTIGAMLYWAEGFQAVSAQIVDFANSKPEMIALFLRFLRGVCGIDETKLRVYLYCHANQNPTELIRFWSRTTKVPRSQFTKPYVRADFREEKAGKMRYGLIHIRYYDKKLLDQIRIWIQDCIDKFAPVG